MSYRKKRYLNAEEKNQLCVMGSAAKFLDNTSNTLVDLGKSASLIKYLRTARTYLNKACTEVLDELDVDERKALEKTVGNMHVVALTRDQALYEMNKIGKVQQRTTIETEAFLDLCSFAINTCVTCTLDENEYRKCILRDILMNNDIEAIDMYSEPFKCQYRYQ